jgi:hypothetical protein
MLSCEEFQDMDESIQSEILWIDGVLLMERKTERLNVELYALFGFYVELFFDDKSEDPLYVKSFQNTFGLDVYLESISIDAVFQ